MRRSIAIKGHTTRGKEVIKILEMLGGKNPNNVYSGRDTYHFYYIDDNGYITTRLYENRCWVNFNYKVFTLEKFLEEFPYKVGDKVRVAEYESEVRINDMKWDGYEIQYEVFIDETEWYSAKELNYCKTNKTNYYE